MVQEDCRTLLATGSPGSACQSVVKNIEAQKNNRRLGLITTAALATVGALALLATSHRKAPATSEVAELIALDGGKKSAEEGQCMPTCPARRLSEVDQMESFITGNKSSKASANFLDRTEDQDECIMKCPSEGYLATVMIRYCKADCIRTSKPSDSQKGKIPETKSPRQICTEKCPTGGNLPMVRHESCAEKCKQDAAVEEAEFEKNWPIVTEPTADKILEHKEIKVVAQLVKKFNIVEMPKRPQSLVLGMFVKAIENSLKTVLGTKDGDVDVFLRHAESGRRLKIVQDFDFSTYPGDVFEAVAELNDCSEMVLDKFASTGFAEHLDSEIKMQIGNNYIIRDAAELFPSQIAETTSVSLVGNYVSMGFNTVCRADKDDHSSDGLGSTSAQFGRTLRQCSQICEELHSECHGFEYRAVEQRCEIWKRPICHHVASPVEAADEDFRCFKKCSP